MIDVYKIDSNGFYDGMYKINIEKNAYYNGTEWLNIDFEYKITKPPHAKIVKWESEQWIVVEEYQAELIQPKEPTSDDYLIDLDFRLSMIELGI